MLPLCGHNIYFSHSNYDCIDNLAEKGKELVYRNQKKKQFSLSSTEHTCNSIRPDAKLKMDSALHFFALVFSCSILTSQTINWDARSLSSPIITRSHRRLKGSTFKSFHAGSLVSCGLQCQRHPRCISSNFRKIVSLDETEKGGVCELNEWGVASPIEGNEDLEYEEESVYIQFYETNVSKDKSLYLFLEKGIINILI